MTRARHRRLFPVIFLLLALCIFGSTSSIVSGQDSAQAPGRCIHAAHYRQHDPPIELRDRYLTGQPATQPGWCAYHGRRLRSAREPDLERHRAGRGRRLQLGSSQHGVPGSGDAKHQRRGHASDRGCSQQPALGNGSVSEQLRADQSRQYGRFAAFLSEVVKRYSQPPYNVRYWEIGNEPDTPIGPDSGFGCWGVNGDPYFGGGAYGNMLKAVYPAIKAANPQVQVLNGSLLLDRPNTPPAQIPGRHTALRRRRLVRRAGVSLVLLLSEREQS